MTTRHQIAAKCHSVRDQEAAAAAFSDAYLHALRRTDDAEASLASALSLTRTIPCVNPAATVVYPFNF